MHYNSLIYRMYIHVYNIIFSRESVDSLCRDDADMPIPPYIKACNRPNAAFLGS